MRGEGIDVSVRPHNWVNAFANWYCHTLERLAGSSSGRAYARVQGGGQKSLS